MKPLMFSKTAKYSQIISIYLILIFNLLIVNQINAQTTGDYRSASTGNWTTLSSWQRYDGTTWLTPTSGQGYPGQNTGTKAITILTGHIINMGNGSNSGGVSTQPFTSITINNNGQLFLSGSNQAVTFYLNTININIISGGTIYFNSKVILKFATDAALTLIVGAGGISGDCTNNTEIYVGTVKYGVCAGAPGDVFDFTELMAAGGTLNAKPTSNSPICEGNTINLIGNYSGAIGSTVTYSWSVTDPGSVVTTYPATPGTFTAGVDANGTGLHPVTIPITSAVAGTYTATLTVSTVLNGTTYTNSETISVVVNALPTLSGATQPITACANTPATINLTGLVPSTTFTLNYSINGNVQTAKTGLIADASGNSSFTTTTLSAANNGQTLQITEIIITNPTTNCTKSFTQDVTLSVWTTGLGTWVGSTSTDWNTASNWCGGAVPTYDTNVVIPAPSASVPNQPTITAAAYCKKITINSGATLTISGSNALEVKGNWTNDGTFTCNSSTVSFTGTVEAQTIEGTGANTFNNLTINNTYSGGGVKAGSNITVNGVLNLAAGNPSATIGALEMVTSYGNYPRTNASNIYVPLTSYILTMGANATTIGAGDVTGKIYRNSLTANIVYTFGNQYTNFSYTVAPTNVTVIVTIGTAYGDVATNWGQPTAVQRSYEMVPTGGAGGRVAMNLHYLDGELQSNQKSKLTTADFDVDFDGGTLDGSPTGDEHGRSSYDDNYNYIGLSGVPIEYFTYNSSTNNWKTIFHLRNYASTAAIWDGSESSSWADPDNWEAGQLPGILSKIIIPDAASWVNLNNVPTLSSNVQIGGMQILSGGKLDLNGNTITLNSDNYNGWEDQSGLSTYSGTVEITNTNYTTPVLGVPHFTNLTINSGASVTVESNSHIYIAGTLTKTGDFYANAYANTVEYNGAAQTIVLPSDMYSSLILSESGTKTLPTSALTINSNMELAGTATTAPTHALTIGGNLTLGSGTTFTGGSLTHNLAGNFINNGATFTNTGSTINLNGTTAQSIGGSSSTTFNNLTINNSTGVTLGIDETVDGTITLTNGLISTGSYALTTGCSSNITSASASSYINGKLHRMYCGTGSKDFPIGKGGNYRPLSLNYTALTGTSTVSAEQFESTIAGSIPSNIYFQSGRYWTISQTGGSSFNYSLSLNGSNYIPGSGTAIILKGDGESNTSIATTYTTPNSIPTFTNTSGLTSFSNFAVGAECTVPTINIQPSATSSCDGNGIPTFAVTASGGGLSYKWEENTGSGYSSITDGGVYSNATTATLTITNPPISMDGYLYRVVVNRDCGSSVTSNAVALTVNALPSITLGANPTACNDLSAVDLTYSGTTGSPTQYRVDFDANAESAGFVDVALTGLPVSPISLTIPSTPGNYNGTIYVTNGNSCESAGVDFSITIYVLPQGSLSGNSICSGETGELTFDATAGSGPFDIVYNDGSDHTASGVYSGTPFSVYTTQTITKTYTLVSVTGSNCARTSSFTGGSADVTVASAKFWTGTTSTDWNIAGNWCGGIPTASDDVIIPIATNQPVISAAGAICKNITINHGASLTINSDGLTVKGDWTTNGTYRSNAGTVIFDGASAQSQNGDGYAYYESITINNSNGITFNSGATVNNTLTLTSGKLAIMGGNTLTIGTSSANGSISGASSSNYIIANAGEGTVRHMINDKDNVTYNYPIGDATNYTPFTFKLNSATSSISNAYLDVYVSANKIPGLNTAITNHLTRYWDFTPGGTITSPNFDITMVYTDNDIVGTESTLLPIKYSNSNNSWYTCTQNADITDEKIGNGSVTVGSNTLAWTGVTSFSSASGASGSGTLPVSLLSFNYMCNEKKQSIDLNWSCASETNNDFYTIESSTDMVSWETIGMVKGAGNSLTLTNYSFSDILDAKTNDKILYYRLKQTDYDGKSEVIGVVNINNCSVYSNRDIQIQPNPVKDNYVTLTFKTINQEFVIIEIIETTGIIIEKRVIQSAIGFNQHQIDVSELASGLYVLKFTEGDFCTYLKIIKQ